MRIGASAPFAVPVTMSATAPSPIGEHVGSVSGSVIIRLDSTSSTVIVFRPGRGLWTAWRRRLTTTRRRRGTVDAVRAHMTLVTLLRDQGVSDVIVTVGGTIPNHDIPQLQWLGVAAVFTPGAALQDIIDSLQRSPGERTPS